LHLTCCVPQHFQAKFQLLDDEPSDSNAAAKPAAGKDAKKTGQKTVKVVKKTVKKAAGILTLRAHVFE
jgi:hypothetical protein